MNLSNFYKQNGNLHNLHILEGERDFLIEHVRNFLEKDFNFPISQNQFYFEKKYDIFLIDHAREVISLQSRHTPENEKTIFVISCSSMTPQAQNSLLKTFEEPSLRTHFFLIVPFGAKILDTVKSRAVKIDIDDFSKKEIKKNKKTESFLEQGFADRIKTVTKIVKDYKEEKISKTDINNFLNNIEKELYERGLKENVDNLKDLQMVRKYLFLNGSSVKVLLEFLAVSLVL